MREKSMTCRGLITDIFSSRFLSRSLSLGCFEICLGFWEGWECACIELAFSNRKSSNWMNALRYWKFGKNARGRMSTMYSVSDTKRSRWIYRKKNLWGLQQSRGHPVNKSNTTCIPIAWLTSCTNHQCYRPNWTCSFSNETVTLKHR